MCFRTLYCLASISFLPLTSHALIWKTYFTFFQKILFPSIVVYMMNIHHDVDGEKGKNVSWKSIVIHYLIKGRFFLTSCLRGEMTTTAKIDFFLCDCHKKVEKWWWWKIRASLQKSLLTIFIHSQLISRTCMKCILINHTINVSGWIMKKFNHRIKVVEKIFHGLFFKFARENLKMTLDNIYTLTAVG